MYTGHIDRRMSEGLDNCVVLHREVCALGYTGSYSTVVQYVRPRRRQRQAEATVRFETAPGEQAQVDWGSLSYLGEDGRRHSVWAFVMTMGWSRACYVELVHPTGFVPKFVTLRGYFQSLLSCQRRTSERNSTAAI